MNSKYYSYFEVFVGRDGFLDLELALDIEMRFRGGLKGLLGLIFLAFFVLGRGRGSKVRFVEYDFADVVHDGVELPDDIYFFASTVVDSI